MKKIIPVILLALTLSACERESVKKLHETCERDVKNSGLSYDCDCQIDIFKKNLSEDELDLLAKFVEAEKVNREESINISSQPNFAPIYKKLITIAPEIEKDCRK